MKYSSLVTAALLALASAGFSNAKAAGPTFKVLHDFSGVGATGGNSPQSGLVKDKAGNLYGTTIVGGAGSNCGAQRCGTVYKLVKPAPGKTAWKHIVLHHFQNASSALPFARLIIDKNGALIGTTNIGSGSGTVFKLTPAAGGKFTYRVLHSFAGKPKDGAFPVGEVIPDAAGALYLMTTEGGANGKGAVIKLTPVATGPWPAQILFSFSTSTGNYGASGLQFVGPVLYGTTDEGGTQNVGVVFSLTKPPAGNGAWTYKPLHTFAGYPTDGQFGRSTLVRQNPKTSILFGMTIQGGVNNAGTIFSQTLPTPAKPTGTYKVLHSFNYDDGAQIYGSLLSNGAGTYYGVASSGGANNKGSVFKFTVATVGHPAKLTVLHSFSGADGETPYGALIFGADGMMYGTTSRGGAHGFGTVFAVKP